MSIPGRERRGSHEGDPSSAIHVTVQKARSIYSAALDLAQMERNIASIERSKVNDSFLDSTQTSLWSFGSERNNEYFFQSWLFLSDKVGRRVDHGYYGSDRIQALQEAFQDKGFETRIHEQYTTTNVPEIYLIIEGPLQHYRLRLGYGSRENEAEHLRQESGGREKITEIELGLNENMLFLASSARNLSLDSDEDAVASEPDEEDEFTDLLTEYAEVYQEVLQCLYEEAQVAPAKTSFVIRPPGGRDTWEESNRQLDALRHESLQTDQPTESAFSEIAGQEAAVEEAKRLVLAINNPEVFARRGVKRPKGILFYGPPGTGKTLIAKAIAIDSNAVFFEVSSSDIGTKWYGESEKKMQKVFDDANAETANGNNVIIFIDEIDALAPSRDDAHEASKKVVSVLLRNLDGLESNPRVTLIAATNRPQDVDPALKRSGRIDKIIRVGLPDKNGRAAILQVHIEKARRNATLKDELFSHDIDFGHVAQVTEGMCGADLANLINITLENKTMDEVQGRGWAPVTTEDLVQGAKVIAVIESEKRRMGYPTPFDEELR